MPSLKADFNELMERIKAGRDFGHASFEPIFYLVFSPASILEVKRQMPAWEAKLRNEGWSVHKFSIAEEIQQILDAAPLRKIWVAADSKAPLQWEKTNKALANALTNGSLQNRLEVVLLGIRQTSNNIFHPVHHHRSGDAFLRVPIVDPEELREPTSLPRIAHNVNWAD